MTVVRIGIDVGGTFTHAIALDAQTLELLADVKIPTTHSAAEGVARGIVDGLHLLLEQTHVPPSDVVYIAHSTTQATNALLEGDVVPVGIVGMGGRGLEAARARGATNIRSLELAAGRSLVSYHVFLDLSGMGEPDTARVSAALSSLRQQGAAAIVAAGAFSVDHPEQELAVVERAAAMGLPGTATSNISKLYGLRARTRTAVINASILPKMLETATMTDSSVRMAGIAAPLMVMRGDGGVMDLSQVKTRPIYTVLSGPAAGVAGALMYERLSDAVFLEVGGTSTDISTIKSGQVLTGYAQIGGHTTYVRSLDTRTYGVAGGSLARLDGTRVHDVGPRSAHIAGLDYASFGLSPADFLGADVLLYAPLSGDPDDYCALQLADGRRVGLCLTDAANAAGVLQPGDYSFGNPDAARAAFAIVGAKIGANGNDLATQMLDVASSRLQRVVQQLINEYQLDPATLQLVGGGGGAATVVRHLAQVMDLPTIIVHKAEVISAIGVALALLRDVVERSIPSPTEADIRRVQAEARESLLRMGAQSDSIQVQVEVDAQQSKVTAVATGSLALARQEVARTELADEELQRIAAESLRTRTDDVRQLADNGSLRVFCTTVSSSHLFGLIRGHTQFVAVVDRYGTVRLKRAGARVHVLASSAPLAELESVLRDESRYDTVVSVPLLYLLAGSQVADLSKLRSIENVLSVADNELRNAGPGACVVAVTVPQ
jgi:N-methylhydantoinase A